MDERAHQGDDSVEDAAALTAPPRSPNQWLRAGGALLRTVAAALSVAVVAAMGYGWWHFGDVDENTVTTDVIAPEVVAGGPEPLDGAVDMLLVGMDSRTDNFGNPLPREVLDMLSAGKVDGERNTDTMILVHIPVDGRRAIAVSFPRDSWVDVGFGKHKLNSAFAYAYTDARKTLSAQGASGKDLEAQATVVGRKNLIATIEKLVGNAVTIERYAEVNLGSFYEVTKAIGGVEVCLRNAVDEKKSGAHFPAGKQVISGKEALQFVRQRYELPNGDFDRIVRQQVFLAALADKVLSADMLTSPAKARELISAVQRSVVLSKGWNLTRFAAQMQGLNSGNIEFHTIPTQGEAKIGGADVVKVDPAEVQRFIRGLVGDQGGGPDPSTGASPTSGKPSAPPTPGSDPLPPGPTSTAGSASVLPSGITVDVRNGSNTRGLAATVQDNLAVLGFGRGAVGDASVRSGSVIHYARGELANAQRVGQSLGGLFTYAEDASLTARHVLVMLGTDFSPRPDSLTGDRVLNLRQAPPSGTTTVSSPSGSSSADPDAPPTRVSIEPGDSVPCVN